MKQKVFIVIPAYNEERSIPSVIKDLKRCKYKNIIVVDDCSKDSTSAKAKREGAIVLRHMINLGQGAALKTGIDCALEEGADIIITFDADGQHLPKDIPKLIKPIMQKKAEIALGSRFLSKDSNVPFLKKIVLKGGILFTWFVSGIMLTDTHNGLRAISREAAKKIRLKQNRMAHASEIIDEIGHHRISFVEVPVTIKYTEYSMQKGQSIFNAFGIAFKMIIRKLVR